MGTTRRNLEETYGHLYTKWYPPTKDVGCFYCGEAFGCWDHCPPIVFVDFLINETRAGRKSRKYPFVLIKSCLDCNKRLAGTWLPTVLERSMHVEKKLLAKFERKFSLWSEKDILEMSPEFQKTIRARKIQLGILMDRIRYAQWRVLQYDNFPE